MGSLGLERWDDLDKGIHSNIVVTSGSSKEANRKMMRTNTPTTLYKEFLIQSGAIGI